MRVVSSTVAALMLLQGGAWGATVVPPIPLVPLNQLAVPEPTNLYQFVKNKAVAIRLGKALFWDMQVGSDGVTACATCHFAAGADSRLRNTLNPGRDGVFDVRGPNDTLVPTDFPFHQRQAPVDFQASPVVRDSDDVVGSQGVRLAQFLNIVPGSRFDNGTAIPDPVFQVGGVNVRQVTARQAPPVINAVFNFTNFWDGRASAFFNGSSPFGPMDPNAGVWFNVAGALVKQKVDILFGSLASQATGPPLSDVEMSYRGRTFPQLGRKMLSLTPLGIQTVHPDDSELGALSRAVMNPDGTISGQKGLNTTYSQMIKDAFQNNLWNSNQLTPDGFTQMEANFSLFWGLAIQLYEATLVSDDTPFDRFLGGDDTALTPQQQDGFNTFFGVGRCDLCHGVTELTNASVRSAAFINNITNALIELMPVASGKQIIYDNGFNNTAVRRTNDDISRGGDSPFLNGLTGKSTPLSFCAQAELQAQGLLPFAAPVLAPNIPVNFPIANDGAFKVPSLRNVELTAPYMHNGGMRTLDEVVDFYTRGGDFPNNNKANLDINIFEIAPLQNDPTAQADLVAFMKSFTDDRVLNEAAPFDHPELFIPAGDPEVFTRLPAKDINGVAAPTLPTVTLTPVTTSTSQTSHFISGTKEAGAAIKVKVNNGQAFPADTATDTTWSTTVTGFASGTNTITVTATDMAGGVTTLTTNIVVNVPTFTITSAADANGSITQAGVTAVLAGASQTYTIAPNPGFTVAALVVDGTMLPGATSYTFNSVAADHYINAYFAPVSTFTVNAAAAPNGTISPAGASTVTSGASQTYTITPNPGFSVTALVVDGTMLPGATSYTFNSVAADHYINAYFAPLSTFTISAAAAPNGTISPAGATAVTSGADQTYTITPDPGFTVTALVVDGTMLPGATAYTFTGVTAPHYINAYFGP